MEPKFFNVEGPSIKILLDKLKRIMPLTKEHFRDTLGLSRITINFKNNEDNNQHVATTNCDVQWGAHKGKNPYRYL
jgi:hypothetical protein